MPYGIVILTGHSHIYTVIAFLEIRDESIYKFFSDFKTKNYLILLRQISKVFTPVEINYISMPNVIKSFCSQETVIPVYNLQLCRGDKLLKVVLANHACGMAYDDILRGFVRLVFV